LVYGLDDLRFETAIWYGDVDLLSLEEQYGPECMARIYFHIQVLEASKLVSLRPEVLDFGSGARFHTVAFEEFWRTIIHRVWAQWRYQNELPNERGPRILSTAVEEPGVPVNLKSPHGEMLLLCGGGKDSLVAMKLLERAGQGYSSLGYSSSVYGTAALQHELIDGLLDHGTPQRRHRQWIFDSLIDSPVLELGPESGLQGMTAAETPTSIFAALPIALAHGYRHVVVGHERSANVGNLVWEATGEEINHQWGKSFEAEQLISSYVQQYLVADIGYWSLLQPVHDAIIFSLLRRDLGAIPATHSCNLRKPWCGRCPKCAYVALGYLAYLPVGPVIALFGGNLLDVEANLLSYRQMLGLEEHTPFECIGQVPEARLAFELCRRKGLVGRAMDAYVEALPNLEVAPILDRFLAIDHDSHGIPPDLAARVLRQFEEGAQEARQLIEGVLGSSPTRR
jgi:hypothetical protein